MLFADDHTTQCGKGDTYSNPSVALIITANKHVN